MILEFDVGNSRAKYRLRDTNGHTLKSGSFLNSELGQLSMCDIWYEAEKAEELTAFNVSCVASGDIRSMLAEFAETLSVKPVFVEATAVCAGVTNSYKQPKKMGVDRWLAMIAAYREAQCAVCVVDCGTALTIDFVATKGQHLGGLILPGRDLLLSSLLRDTENVKFNAEGAGNMRLGRSTAEAVHNGVLYMLVGAIHEAIGRHQGVAESEHGGQLEVYLTGGGAMAIEPLLDCAVRIRPALVMDGLKYAV